MAGQVLITDVGRDEIAKWLGGKNNGTIYKFRLGEGRFDKSELIEDVIEATATGTENEYSYTITGGDFDIVGVDQGTKTFSIAGDQTEYFSVDAQIKVEESVGNNGLYTVVSATYTTETDIVVSESIPSATVDGVLYIDRLPILKGPVTDQYHHPLKVVEYNGVTPVQTVEDTTGVGNLTGDGTGTINYKTGILEVSFAANVGAGNSVVVEYKYANVPLVPVSSKEQLDSQLDTQGPSGTSSLYTFSKDFTASDLVYRGDTYATMRCTCALLEPEGIDDGTTWGGTPYYFEGGVFNEDDVMIAYFTFDKQRKRGGATITHTVDLVV